MKTQKGITIIALLITIILMLILAGVSVSVALDRELFNTAQKAAKQTQIATDTKQLQAAVIRALGIDGKVDFTYLNSNLPKEFKLNDGFYESEAGNKFIVEENSNISLVGAP